MKRINSRHRNCKHLDWRDISYQYQTIQSCRMNIHEICIPLSDLGIGNRWLIIMCLHGLGMIRAILKYLRQDIARYIWYRDGDVCPCILNHVPQSFRLERHSLIDFELIVVRAYQLDTLLSHIWRSLEVHLHIIIGMHACMALWMNRHSRGTTIKLLGIDLRIPRTRLRGNDSLCASIGSRPEADAKTSCYTRSGSQLT